jgi:hypothetical protein
MKRPAAKKPARAPKLWRVKRAGKEIGAYHVTVGGVRVNLGTQDAGRALERRALAVKGRRSFRSDVEGAADDIIAKLNVAAHEQGGAAPSGAHTPAAVGSTPAPATVGPPDVAGSGGASPPDDSAPAAVTDPAAASGDWHANLDAAVAASAPADSGAPPAQADPEITDQQLAELGVDAQMWAARQYARTKVYKAFEAPPVPDAARAHLVAEWKKIVAYGGVANMLPPWVMGLAVPAITIITTTVVTAQAYAELAAQQAKAAGVTPGNSDAAAAPAPEASAGATA